VRNAAAFRCGQHPGIFAVLLVLGRRPLLEDDRVVPLLDLQPAGVERPAPVG